MRAILGKRRHHVVMYSQPDDIIHPPDIGIKIAKLTLVKLDHWHFGKRVDELTTYGQRVKVHHVKWIPSILHHL